MYLIFIYNITLRKNCKVKTYNCHKKLKQKETVLYLIKSKTAKSKHEVLFDGSSRYNKSHSMCSYQIKIY